MTAVPNLGTMPAGAADATAVIERCGAGWRKVSYACLDALADAVARGLFGYGRSAGRRSAAGLAPGARVGILGANGVDFLAAYLGILRAGLVAVPVNWRLPPATIRFILEDAGVELVFCDAERRALCPEGLPRVVFGVEGEGGFVAFCRPGAFEAVAPGERQAALILYTSGSTGRPKGVVLSHAGYAWILRTRTQGAALARHRFPVAAPLYHMNALNTLQLALTSGATAVLLPQFEAKSYLQAIDALGCTWLTMVPTMIALMAREEAALETLDLSSVEMVRLGSAPLAEGTITAARALFPRAVVANGYGATEIGSVVFGPHPDGRPTPPLAFGCAHPSVALRLNDGGDRAADQGVLEVKTPAAMLGYHNLPEQTAAAFTADGYYVTGDVMRRDDAGFYWFVGRADDMFVCGGENVYPDEVERLLARHPDVAEACVVPVLDALKGMKPVAFVVPRPGAYPTPEAIKAFTLAEGPAYAHPRAIHLLAAMPLVGTNKIDRAALAARAAQAENEKRKTAVSSLIEGKSSA